MKPPEWAYERCVVVRPWVAARDGELLPFFRLCGSILSYFTLPGAPEERMLYYADTPSCRLALRLDQGVLGSTQLTVKVFTKDSPQGYLSQLAAFISDMDATHLNYPILDVPHLDYRCSRPYLLQDNDAVTRDRWQQYGHHYASVAWDTMPSFAPIHPARRTPKKSAKKGDGLAVVSIREPFYGGNAFKGTVLVDPDDMCRVAMVSDLPAFDDDGVMYMINEYLQYFGPFLSSSYAVVGRVTGGVCGVYWICYELEADCMRAIDACPLYIGLEKEIQLRFFDKATLQWINQAAFARRVGHLSLGWKSKFSQSRLYFEGHEQRKKERQLVKPEKTPPLVRREVRSKSYEVEYSNPRILSVRLANEPKSEEESAESEGHSPSLDEESSEEDGVDIRAIQSAEIPKVSLDPPVQPSPYHESPRPATWKDRVKKTGLFRWAKSRTSKESSPAPHTPEHQTTVDVLMSTASSSLQRARDVVSETVSGPSKAQMKADYDSVPVFGEHDFK